MIDGGAIQYRWDTIGSKLDERGRRLFAAAEVRTAGWGGLSVVARITRLARSTINRGENDLDAEPLAKGQVRRSGGGRRAVAETDPELVPELKRLVEPAILGDPMRPLIWVSKSMDKLPETLTAMGHPISADTVRKAVPYGVYDVAANAGFVSVGITSDTAEFAVEAIRGWLGRMGRQRYPKARELTITADCGGSNGARVRLWKVELQKLADETELVLHVHHYPPGTSKWNKIEHRMFCHVTQNWRGRPLTDRLAIVELIDATTTKAGLIRVTHGLAAMKPAYGEIVFFAARHGTVAWERKDKTDPVFSRRRS